MGIDFKINNSLKNIDKGFVKVNNTLKQIDKGWTRINGVLKEFYSSFPLPIIAGDTEAGYCGKITGLCTQTNLENITGVTGTYGMGTSRNLGDITWLAFAYKEKLLYVADRTLRYDVLYLEMNKLNLFQGKQITIGNNKYICRSIEGGLNYQTITLPDGAKLNIGVPPNEWDDLIVRFTPDTNDSHWSDTDPVTRLGYFTICKDIIRTTGNVITFVRRGQARVDYWESNSSDNHNRYEGWRPVLELIQE